MEELPTEKVELWAAVDGNLWKTTKTRNPHNGMKRSSVRFCLAPPTASAGADRGRGIHKSILHVASVSSAPNWGFGRCSLIGSSSPTVARLAATMAGRRPTAGFKRRIALIEPKHSPYNQM
jgi:hypothetical protein